MIIILNLIFQAKYEKEEDELDAKIKSENNKLTQEKTKLKMNKEQMVRNINYTYSTSIG